MNNTCNVDDRVEYRRVLATVSQEAFDEAREMLEKNPQQFYNQLVVLLWNTEDWEDCGTNYKTVSIQRNIFDIIQGIAARDSKTRECNAQHKKIQDKRMRKFKRLCAKIQQEHPDTPKLEIEQKAVEQMEQED